eukprot:RCo051891
MTEALPELPRSSLSMRNSVTGSQSNAATPSADVDGASPTTGYFSSGGSGSSGPPSPTSPSMGVRMRFSELECRRRSIYEKHAMLLQQEQASVLMEHMVREAMRRHVEAERRDRPQRERRQVRVQLWLTIIFAVSPVYTFTDAARQMQGMIILRKVLAVIWYRKWTNARAAKQRQALLEERAATMTRPTAKALARHKFFESFPRDSLEKLIRVMVPAHCSAGQNFILEGDPSTGQGMWIIDSGSAEVLVKKPPADGEPLNKRRCRANCSLVATLGDGDYFGEFGLLSGEPRMATVRCLTEVTAWHLPPQPFFTEVRALDATTGLLSTLLNICYERRLQNMSTLYAVTPFRMRSTTLFSEWRDDQLRDVIKHFKPYVVQAGDVVLREGEPGDAMYLIAKGRVEIYTDRPHFTSLAMLTDGQIFGEIACLFLEPRCASARCVTNCDLWYLPRQELRNAMLTNALSFYQAKAAVNAQRARWLPKLHQRFILNCPFFKARYAERVKRVCHEVLPMLTPRVWGQSDVICERNARIAEWIFFLSGEAEGSSGQLYSEGSFIGGDEKGAWAIWPDTLRARTKVAGWVLPADKLRDLLERFPPTGDLATSTGPGSAAARRLSRFPRSSPKRGPTNPSSPPDTGRASPSSPPAAGPSTQLPALPGPTASAARGTGEHSASPPPLSSPGGGREEDEDEEPGAGGEVRSGLTPPRSADAARKARRKKGYGVPPGKTSRRRAAGGMTAAAVSSTVAHDFGEAGLPPLP